MTFKKKLVTSNQLPVTKLDAKQLRKSKPTKADLLKIKRRPIYIICDNVLDTYNIGSIFRLADAVAAKCVYLCAGSETPPNSRIAKASVGTDKWVSWRYASTAAEAIAKVKSQSENLPAGRQGVKVIAIEQHSKAKDFRNINYQPSTIKHEQAFAFVVGHETDGVSKEALALCDEIVEIPMFGINKSLNVMVSLAVVLYRVI